MKKVPEKGDLVTISRSKTIGDGSYARNVWKVEAVNETHVKVRIVGGERYNPIKETILPLDDFEFSLADDFFLF